MERTDSGRVPAASQLVAALQGFAPGLIARRLHQDLGLPREPRAELIHSAVLFSDISGFTALTERLARRGARGAEDVKEVLNGCFGPLIDIIHDHGGAIEKFAGDATLALWPAESAEELPAAIARAMACCLDIRQALDGSDRAEGFQLRLRMAVTAGSAWLATTGGVDSRWETLVTGEALQQIAPAIRQALPGQIVLSPQAWDLVRDEAVGEMIEDGCLRLDDLQPRPPQVASPDLELPPEALEVLRSFVPNSVQARFQAGHTSWLAEFRRVSILFVRFGSFELRTEASVDLLHHAFRAIQSAIYRFGGSVNQLVTDDKGNCVVAAWGLPSRHWEDNAGRALRAAMSIEEALATLEVDGALGIATGQIFTGPRGTLRRRDYAMIGDAVNLAARLMQSARGGILCDAATRQAAAREIDFETLPPIALKGKEERVEIFRPLARSKKSEARRQAVIGRERERELLAERLTRLLAGESSTVLIEGDAGIGKSHLIDDFLDRSADAGAQIAVGHGDAIERALAFHAWRPIFGRLLGFDELIERGDSGDAVMIERLREWLPAESWARAPLLDPLLPFDLPETEATSSLTVKGRADARRELLLGMLRRAAAAGPLIVALEDAQWLDSSSWDLAEAAHREVAGLLLVIGSRTLRESEITLECRRLLDDLELLRLPLEALDDASVLELVCRRLNVDSIPESVQRLLLDRAEGHPLFTEELVYSLRDRGLIKVVEGRCQLAAGLALEGLSLPDSAQGVVTGRIDILEPQQQLTLKVASVLGRRFDPRILRDIHPILDDRDAIPSHLAALASLDLVQLAGDDERDGYRFKHSITQEAAYELLPFAQRRELHRAVAEWHEHEAPEIDQVYALLAHHWTQAEVPTKALDYLEQAGKQAERSYAYEEVARFFDKALALDAQLADAGELDRRVIQLPGGVAITARTARRARWERLLGFAKANLGRLEEGAGNLGNALRLVGRPLPSSRKAWAWETAKLALRQTGHRLFPRRNHRYHGEASECLLESARAYARLGSYYYVTTRNLNFMHTLVSALNTCELAQPSPELAMAYGDVCNVAGLIPLHRLAQAYVRLALQTAAQVDQMATSARVLSRTAIYRYAIGDWPVEKDLERSIVLAERLGDPYQWEESVYLLANVKYFTGRLAESMEHGQAIRERARRSGTLVHEIWGIAHQADSALYLGRLDEAIDLSEECLRLLAGSDANYRDSVIRTWGILALAHLRRNDFDRAIDAAEAAGREIDKSPRTGYIALQGYSGSADVFLTLAERRLGADLKPRARNGLPDEIQAMVAGARHACQRLERYVRTFPVAVARCQIWRGRLLALEGKADKAQQAWRKGLLQAESQGLPFDRALAHAQLSRGAGGDAGSHLERAIELFAELGVPWELEQAQRLRPP